MKYCERCGRRPRTYWPSRLCDFCLHMPFHPTQAMKYEEDWKKSHPEELISDNVKNESQIEQENVTPQFLGAKTTLNTLEDYEDKSNNERIKRWKEEENDDSMSHAYRAMGLCGVIGFIAKGLEGLFLGIALGFAITSFVFICKNGSDSLRK